MGSDMITTGLDMAEERRENARLRAEVAALRKRLDKYEAGHCVRCRHYSSQRSLCKSTPGWSVETSPLDYCGRFAEAKA